MVAGQLLWCAHFLFGGDILLLMNSKLLKSVFSDDPDMLRTLEAREQSLLLKEVLKENITQNLEKARADAEEVNFKFLKGEKGDEPSDERLQTLIVPLIPAPLKGDKGEKGKQGLQGERGEAGLAGVSATPIHKTEIVREELTINEQLVKQIIEIMHSLPEVDKLEVSKGLRNAQSFIFNGTKYKTEELMHGGGPTLVAGTNISITANANGTTTINGTGSGAFSVIAVAGTIDDSNVTFTSASEPTLLNINGGFYQKTGGSITWSYLAGTITLSSPVGTGGSIYGIA